MNPSPSAIVGCLLTVAVTAGCRSTHVGVDALRANALLMQESRLVLQSTLVLVNRHESAEMGHADVVKIVMLDARGRIVAKTRRSVSLDYPLCFVHQDGWHHDFLL